MTRRLSTISDQGRNVMTEEPYAGVIGVVNVSSPDDLERLDDNDRAGRHISIITRFPLRGPARQAGEADSKPDLVEWQGDQYLVKALDPYPQYGAGFVQAIAGSIDAIEVPIS